MQTFKEWMNEFPRPAMWQRRSTHVDAAFTSTDKDILYEWLKMAYEAGQESMKEESNE